MDIREYLVRTMRYESFGDITPDETALLDKYYIWIENPAKYAKANALLLDGSGVERALAQLAKKAPQFTILIATKGSIPIAYWRAETVLYTQCIQFPKWMHQILYQSRGYAPRRRLGRISPHQILPREILKYGNNSSYLLSMYNTILPMKYSAVNNVVGSYGHISRIIEQKNYNRRYSTI